MLIDMHAHTTNSRLWDLHTETATIEDLEGLAEKHGISLIVLMATYFPFKKSGLKNRELLKRIAGKKLFRAFLSLDAMNKTAEGIAELRELADHPQFIGIKLYPGYQKFRLAGENVFPVYELAERKNLPVAVHAGELHHCCPRDGRVKYWCQKPGRCQIDQLGHLSRPGEIFLAASLYPGVKFIMSHLGNPYFEEARMVMRECPNVYTDISGQFVSGSAEDAEEYRQEIVGEIGKFLALPQGTERLLFASDFPIQSHADSIALVKALGLPAEDEERIFSGNAQRLLNLKEI